MMSKRAVCSSAALLCALSGAALGQATDGRITDAAEAGLYGAPKWVNATTTGFGNANTNNDPCDPNNTGGDPALVTKGIEMKIPLSEIGSPAGAVGFCVFINNGDHNYASNQFLPPLPLLSGNLGGDGTGGFNGTLSLLNMGNFAGDQFVFATPASGAATVDGTLDAAYGAPITVQNNRTRFGNANNGLQAANGSELDALYVMKDATHLYIFISGNQEANFNKVEIFLDSTAGGENTIQADNADVDGNCINTKLAGFTFDAGFNPDYYFTWGVGNGQTYYPNAADLNNNTGSFLGCNDAGTGEGILDGCGIPPAIEVALDNSNAAGVDGPCPARGPDVANGSELDGLFSYIAGGRLHLLVTGNLENGGGTPCEAGGNKLNLFFDVGSRLDIDRDGDGQPDLDIGQNPLLANTQNVSISYGNLDRMGGLQFDPCFVPDYWMSYKIGGDPVYHVVDSAVLRTAGKRVNALGSAFDYGAYDGGIKNDYNPITFRGNFTPCNQYSPDDPQTQSGFDVDIYTNFAARAAADSLNMNFPGSPVGTPGLIEASINNSNIGGVEGTGGSVSDAANVTTGFEFSIDLAELGWDGTSCIKIGGFITSGDATYGSNQVIGGLPGQDFPNLGNMGNMNTIDFASIEGEQWVVVSGTCECESQCPPCAADFNQDGGVDGSDVEAFFSAWEGGDACGDVNEDGGVDGSDVEAFFIVWENGGC